jgi:hypothetical protein
MDSNQHYDLLRHLRVGVDLKRNGDKESRIYRLDNLPRLRRNPSYWSEKDRETWITAGLITRLLITKTHPNLKKFQVCDAAYALMKELYEDAHRNKSGEIISPFSRDVEYITVVLPKIKVKNAGQVAIAKYNRENVEDAAVQNIKKTRKRKAVVVAPVQKKPTVPGKLETNMPWLFLSVPSFEGVVKKRKFWSNEPIPLTLKPQLVRK